MVKIEILKNTIFYTGTVFFFLSVTDAHALQPPPEPKAQITVTPKSVDFGSVNINVTKEETLTVTNSGNDNLEIGLIANTGIEEPFTVLTDNCSNQSLAPSSSCDLMIRFYPASAGIFNDNLYIPSNDPDEVSMNVGVNGTGQSSISNNPPDSLTLAYPADGQAGLPTSFTFIWQKTTDPDGDPLTYALYYCNVPEVTTCPAIPVVSSKIFKSNEGIYADIGRNSLVFLFGCVFFGGLKRRNGIGISLLVGMLTVGGTLLISACGGGSGSDTQQLPDNPGSGDKIVLAVSNLRPGITYYWKVVVTDNNGGSTESETRSFTTQQNQ